MQVDKNTKRIYKSTIILTIAAVMLLAGIAAGIAICANELKANKSGNISTDDIPLSEMSYVPKEIEFQYGKELNERIPCAQGDIVLREIGIKDGFFVRCSVTYTNDECAVPSANIVKYSDDEKSSVEQIQTMQPFVKQGSSWVDADNIVLERGKTYDIVLFSGEDYESQESRFNSEIRFANMDGNEMIFIPDEG